MLVSFSTHAFENCLSQSISDLESCSANNFNDEDSKLNYLYKSLINSYPELKGSIKNTQVSWLKARNSICKYSQADGEEYKVYKNSCMLEQTNERNRELKAIFLKQSSLKNKNIPGLNLLWEEYLKSHCEFMQDKYSDNNCINRNNFLHSQE